MPLSKPRGKDSLFIPLFLTEMRILLKIINNIDLSVGKNIHIHYCMIVEE